MSFMRARNLSKVNSVKENHMRLMKAVFSFLLVLTLFTIPAMAQTVDTNGDHHDTNSKTKKAAKKVGEKTKDIAGATADKTKDVAKGTKNAVTGDNDKLDINTATKDQLTALNGIGDVYSQKIIDNRPYRAKSDLVKKNVLPQATYDKVKDQIIA